MREDERYIPNRQANTNSDQEAGAPRSDELYNSNGAGEVIEGELAPDHAAADRRVDVSEASFRGPLPPPDDLAHYDRVLPGLAMEIVDQWKAETAHRHQTIDHLRETDRLSVEAFHAAERRGQYLSLVVVAALLGVVVLTVVLHAVGIGIAAVVSATAPMIWALRRSSTGPLLQDGPHDLANGDELERPPDPE